MARKTNSLSSTFGQSVGTLPNTRTPQTQRAPGREDQVQNSAGGYVFEVSDEQKLRRLLVLGTEGGTFYIKEQALTLANAQSALAFIKADGVRVVGIVEALNSSTVATDEDAEAGTEATKASAVSVVRKQPSIFVLALAVIYGDEKTRRAAYQVLGRHNVVSTFRQMYDFLNTVYELTNGKMKWGSGMKRALDRWLQKTGSDWDARWLAMQAVKYRNGTYKVNGNEHSITNRDILRLAHPTPKSETFNRVFKYMSERGETERFVPNADEQTDALKLIGAFEEAQKTTDYKRIVQLIHTQGLTWEMIPNTWFSDDKQGARKEIWRALLGLDAAGSVPATHKDGTPRWSMGLTALLRNLPRLGAYGVLAELNTVDVQKLVIDTFTDAKAEERLIRARVHPLRVLMALRGYQQGYTTDYKGTTRLTWKANPRVLAALEKAFYTSFGAIESTGKSIFYALDISGSMGSGEVAGVKGLTPRDATAVLSMALVRREDNWMLRGFGSNLRELNIRPDMTLEQATKVISGLPFDSTDCALPMIFAKQHKLQVDAFVIMTDSETWAGRIQPMQALEEYRQASGRNAKLVVIGMEANPFTIADPRDKRSLDIVGFDTSAISVMQDFIADKF